MRLITLALLCAAIAGPALAQTAPATVAVKPDAIIAARQAGMDLSYGTFTGIKEAVKDKEDVKQWEVPAQALQGWAAALPALFPPGTEKGHETAALPAVWSDQAGFQKLATAYGVAAGKLAAAAKADDKAAFAAAFKETGKVCGACHKTYKKKES